MCSPVVERGSPDRQPGTAIGAAPRDAERDLRRHDAVHRDPGDRAGAALHFPRHRVVAAERGV